MTNIKQTSVASTIVQEQNMKKLTKILDKNTTSTKRDVLTPTMIKTNNCVDMDIKMERFCHVKSPLVIQSSATKVFNSLFKHVLCNENDSLDTKFRNFFDKFRHQKEL